MRTIRVTGKGNLKVKPDTTRLMITLNGVYPEYAETINRSTAETEALRELLVEVGFNSSAMKTLSFDVDTEFESYRDENNDYKRRFVGYKFTHTLKVDFPSDNELLGKTLFTLSRSNLAPEFRISYIVADPEAVKNELIGKAVEDAMKKAEVLAKAAGLTLGSIQTVDYSWGEINMEVRPMDDMLMSPCAGRCEMDIEPDDIDLSDTVTVVWEIS